MLQFSGEQTVRVTYFEQDTLKEGGAYVIALEGEALRETEQFREKINFVLTLFATGSIVTK